MELSSEDAFRLNVLLANVVKAVRINESTMVVHALTDQGEAKVPLNPNCRDDRYLPLVRDLLSGHAMGSPGGYPVYLQRWTRMGQASSENLQQLLLLGDDEAIIAVVCSPDITDELARRAWWAAPTSDNARRMLCASAVIQGEMGPVLADHLVEHLAFEDDPQIMIDSVSLLLQPGLVDAPTILKVWAKAKKKNSYLVGFLKTLPKALPEVLPEHAQYKHYEAVLAPLIEQDNALAVCCLHSFSAQGQTYWQSCETVLKKPINQDVVTDLFETIRYHCVVFQPADWAAQQEADLDSVIAAVEARLQQPEPALQALLTCAPALRPRLEAMMVFACLGFSVLRPVFAKSSAIGTLMRKKLKPITDPIFTRITILG